MYVYVNAYNETKKERKNMQKSSKCVIGDDGMANAFCSRRRRLVLISLQETIRRWFCSQIVSFSHRKVPSSNKRKKTLRFDAHYVKLLHTTLPILHAHNAHSIVVYIYKTSNWFFSPPLFDLLTYLLRMSLIQFGRSSLNLETLHFGATENDRIQVIRQS